MLIKPLALLSVALIALSLGCGDEVPVGENQERYNTENPPEDLDDQSRLIHILDGCQDETGVCTLGATVNAQRTLKVQLLNADNEPIADGRIDFDTEVIQGGGDMELAANSAFTNSDGIAETTIYIGDDPAQAQGTVEISAEVSGDDDIDDLVFRIGVSPKNAASYIIEFDHQGNSSPDHVQPFLIDASSDDISCDQVLDQYLENHQPQADIQLPTETVHPDGNVNTAVFPDVNNGDSYVVLGIGQQEIDNQQINLAYGCNDDAPVVEQGVDQHVEVALNDHIPYLAEKPEGERYDVNHQFDLTDALPAPIQQIIDLIATLADNPGEFIIGGDSFGLIDDVLLDFVPDSIADQIETLLDNDTAVAAAQDFLNDVIEDAMPDWVNDTAVAAGDITDMLQEFTVSGRIYFNQQPVPAMDNGQAVGLVYEADTEHYWDTLVFQWSLGCEDSPDPDECAEIEIGANDLGSDQSDIIFGQFDATVFGSDAIEIERHSLTLHYGALLIAIIEQVVLPRLINDNVTSLDDLFDELGICSGLAGAVGDEGDNLYDAALGMCQDLQSQATQALYDYVEDALVADGDDHFRIGTPEGEPCSIEQPSNYPTSNWAGNPLPFVDTWGQADGEMGCQWDVEINYSGGTDPDQVIGGQFDADFVD